MKKIMRQAALGSIFFLCITAVVRGQVPAEALLPESALEIVAELDEPPGNIAVTGQGRIFFTAHPEAHPQGPKLFELKNRVPVPYPDAAFQKNFRTPLGLTVDAQNKLWVIDHGSNGLKNPRLFAFDLNTDKPAHDYKFKRSEAPLGSYLNDLRVSPDGQIVYLADISFFRKDPAIVIYDVRKRKAWRALEDDPSVKPGKELVRSRLKTLKFFGGLVKIKLGVDGIALGPAGHWLYYAPMNQDKVYRVKIADARNPMLTVKDLSRHVEVYAPKPFSDGIEMDASKNLYVTDVERGAICRIDPERRLETLIISPKIRWPDGLSVAGGYLYFTDSDLGELLLGSRKKTRKAAPFYIYRVKL